MADTRTPEVRRKIMQSVGSKNTGPELTIRRALFERGYRYRLHRKDLPGSPDIVFPARKKAIFVHGCFWHGHSCPKGRAPKSRADYWGPKIEANRLRDARNVRELAGLGWQALVVWQCELGDLEKTLQHIIFFLEEPINTIDKKGEGS
ncbi:very short patch repair endonuclease [Rhizobium leguminosarum]|uniref:very short patch repair endonuclease n=1 Tax=Rhizobium leguminosarum TaxID=384 RepID=UPI00103FA364|nr:very short patch repair endonuclease [Rhizobium leguminosarum]TBZ79632.1 DNA mismatch endonuclease Vsr [Rhizobium leguminosarum bv. viciae]